MPIEIQCSGCQKKLRVADKFAGKKAKCPNCQATIEIPAAAADEQAPASATPAKSTPAPKPAEQPASEPAAKQPAAKQPAAKQPAAKPSPAKQAAAEQPAPSKTPATGKAVPKPKDEWFLKTEDGEEYGPVTRAELDDWAEEGRLDATCQVLCDGWEQWQWAEDVFPHLGEGGAASAEEPAATPSVAPAAGVVDLGVKTSEPNAYASPQADLSPAGEGGTAAVTKGTRQALAETRPWVFFLSILGFIGGGFGALGGLIALALLTLAGGLGGLVFGMMTLIGPSLILVMSYFLFTYAQKIQAFLRRDSGKELEAAMVAQKNYWKLVGILTLVAICLYVLMFVLMAALGGMAFMAASHAAPHMR